MKSGSVFVVLLLPFAFVLMIFGQNVSRNYAWVNVNASTFDLKLFRERFDRRYEVDSQQFDRRLFFFQVGRWKAKLGNCCANTPFCLRSGLPLSPASFNF